jgi:hypothetical protein
LQDSSEVANTIEGLIAANVEVEGEKKPACAAEIVFRFYS